MPRYLIEAISFGGMLSIVLFLMRSEKNFADIIPIIALYTFAGYRLMPALQQAYHSLSQINFTSLVIDKLYLDLQNHKQLELKNVNKINVPLKNLIELEDVEFSYPSAITPSLMNTTLKILANTSVGIVGLTGGGKTTLVDLILGLLEPQKGVLKIDGEVINDLNRRGWQKNIGYVPQQIHLIDDTILANISLGVAPDDVRFNEVVAVAKMANLHDFIVNDLPQGYLTRVGERGVRFSGGQRQRLGIARSLYHKPQLLILDEATSSLDNITENLIINTLKNLGQQLTIIIIAHRLTTVRHCDKIYIMDKGVIANSGSYEDLLKLDKNFQKLNNGSI
jgi:ABC-type multidrug transport system fused ATPase/permease subunit